MRKYVAITINPAPTINFYVFLGRMTDFHFVSLLPDPLLRPYVAKIWMFESTGRFSALERKLIVPNANLKLTLCYRNGITALIGPEKFLQRENELTLTGLIDQPVILDPYDDTATGTIIIEFNQLGAYRLFHLSFANISNHIVDLRDLLARSAKELQSQLEEASTPSSKLELLQNFLINQLMNSSSDAIYDYCIDRICRSQGLVSVARLEKETGYSARWINVKFSEHLGTSPKNLAEIIRFKQFYHAYSTGTGSGALRQHIYDYYHDQSHFLRSFKRFTGATPTELKRSMNELSTRNFTS